MTPLDRFACEETFRRLDDYVDRELAAEEIRLIEQHLATCAVCAREFRFEATVLERVRAKVEHIAVPRDLLRRILAQLPRPDDRPPHGGS